MNSIRIWCSGVCFRRGFSVGQHTQAIKWVLQEQPYLIAKDLNPYRHCFLLLCSTPFGNFWLWTVLHIILMVLWYCTLMTLNGDFTLPLILVGNILHKRFFYLVKQHSEYVFCAQSVFVKFVFYYRVIQLNNDVTGFNNRHQVDNLSFSTEKIYFAAKVFILKKENLALVKHIFMKHVL